MPPVVKAKQKRWRSRVVALCLGLAGAILAAALVAHYGLLSISALLWHARYGILLIIALHGVQLGLTAAAWHFVMPSGSRSPSRATVTFVRLVREGINGLLPVAQIGGILAAIHMLRRAGLTATTALAATIVDMTLEMITQAIFTLCGLVLLVHALGQLPPALPVTGILAAFAAMLGCLIACQGLGSARIGEWMAQRLSWANKVEGLQKAIRGIYNRPAALMRAGLCHLLAWMLGAAEIWLALYFLDCHVSMAQALIVESIGQVIASASFAVPGALGIQEGGYLILCGLFGVGPDIALSLSLIKRLRALALGVPSIALWLWIERARPRQGECPSGKTRGLLDNAV